MTAPRAIRTHFSRLGKMSLCGTDLWPPRQVRPLYTDLIELADCEDCIRLYRKREALIIKRPAD